jgi:hypothetical protein
MASSADIERHRREAERCRRLARQMTDPAIQAQFNEIAETYEMLARQLEQLLGPPNNSD